MVWGYAWAVELTRGTTTQAAQSGTWHACTRQLAMQRTQQHTADIGHATKIRCDTQATHSKNAGAFFWWDPPVLLLLAYVHP